MMKKLLGLGLVVVGALSAFTSWLSFDFPSFGASDPIGSKFADAHFFTPGNNYAGSFFWLPTEQILPAVGITVGGDTRYCTKVVRGLYFSNAWGARLWPMDAQTYTGLLSLSADYSDLAMSGGLYTSCANPATSGNLELYSMYGQLNYTWKGKAFKITMGRRYNLTGNSMISGGPLVSSAQYFNNQTPLGYFYDNIAGVGFIGGLLPFDAHTGIVHLLNTGGYINSIFRFTTGSTSVLYAHTSGGDFTLTGAINAGLDTLWRIAVLGNVLLSKWGLGVDDRRSILGNPNQWSAIVVSDKMNISNSINQLKRNASALCRGKKVYDYTTWTSASENIICVGAPADDFTETDPVVIDLATTADYSDKTIIVYGKNVTLQGTMPASTSYSLNLFIDRGNALIDEVTPTVTFDKDGNLSGSITGTYIRGNLFINGLLLGEAGSAIAHKLYIHGKFASLNTGLEPTDARKDQINALFTNSYTTYGSLLDSTFCGGNNCINFNNIFSWHCQLDGRGTDGNLCNVAGDRFKYNPFIVIDTNIATPLLGS